ncbi:MAG: sugar transferase [candidate division KSB1 bacterium]|nr:sugar transferase [candidate division KSB1 bacterium]
MRNLRRTVADNVLRIHDVLIMLATFMATLYIHAPEEYPANIVDFLSFKITIVNLAAAVILILIWLKLFETFGLYQRRGVMNSYKELMQLVKAIGIGTALIGAVSLLFVRKNISKDVLLYFLPLCFVITFMGRLIIKMILLHLRERGRNKRFVVFVGANRGSIELAQKIMSHKELGYKLLGFIDDEQTETADKAKAHTLCSLDEFGEFLNKTIVDEVYIALPIEAYYRKVKEIIEQCQEIGVTCRIPSNWFDLKTNQTDAFDLDGLPIMTLYTGSMRQMKYLWLKRLIDVAIASVLLIVCLPIFMLIFVAVKLDSRGPVLFEQKRMGYNRRKFSMLKFRTMVPGAEDMLTELEHLNETDGPVFKIKDDPRITRVGRFLRRTSLDELPQLFNVIRGDMSLVGPRPLPLRDVRGIQETWQKRRFSMRPGLTCLWQISGRNHMAFKDWMKLDLKYIDDWSIMLDFKILMKTVPVLFKCTGQ